MTKGELQKKVDIIVDSEGLSPFEKYLELQKLYVAERAIFETLNLENFQKKLADYFLKNEGLNKDLEEQRRRDNLARNI